MRRVMVITLACIVVYVPQEKTVFAGDNLNTDFHAFVGTAEIDGWQKNL